MIMTLLLRSEVILQGVPLTVALSEREVIWQGNLTQHGSSKLLLLSIRTSESDSKGVGPY